MGIVNVTPDSFSDGGLRFDAGRAVADAIRMVADGADILDVGGESTRPGARPVDADEEWRRVGPVLHGLREAGVSVPMSIDTSKAVVAERAIDAGAVIVNDVSALAFDAALAAVVARTRAAVVLMHTRGRPQTMAAEARYGDDVVGEVTRELDARSFESRRVPGLHFIGEVVDVTGWLGGYNFQWAWSSAACCAEALAATVISG